MQVVSSDATFSILQVPQPPGFVSDITCSESIGSSDPVAVVQLHDATEVVLRDYADPDNPRTACRFGTTSRVVQLIDAHHVVIETSVSGVLTWAVVDLPEVSYHWFQLPEAPDALGATFVAVAPGLDQVLWYATHGEPLSFGKAEVHVTTTSGDEVVASLPHPIGGRCGSPEDSKIGAYTHTGTHAFVLDQPIASSNSLIALEGTSTPLSLLPPAETGWGDAYPAMATWSPVSDTLYYRQGSDVWRWTPRSGPEVLLAGVRWYYPTVSPDGRHLAYAAPLAEGGNAVYLLDLTRNDGPRLIGEARNRPVFLNNEQLWYMSEGQGLCGPGVDRPLIYSVNDGSEAPSVIDMVIATWPATGSNQ